MYKKVAQLIFGSFCALLIAVLTFNFGKLMINLYLPINDHLKILLKCKNCIQNVLATNLIRICLQHNYITFLK